MVKMDYNKARFQKEQTGFQEGQKVALHISGQTEMGYVAVINGTHKGILYKNEVFQPLQIGQEIDGFVKKVRDDQKIDLCLQKPGYKAIDALSRKILDEIKKRDGFVAVTDKSRPEVIADLFGVSKKTFKKTIGNLYKNRLIALEKDGIRLRTKPLESDDKGGVRKKSGYSEKPSAQHRIPRNGHKKFGQKPTPREARGIRKPNKK